MSQIKYMYITSYQNKISHIYRKSRSIQRNLRSCTKNALELLYNTLRDAIFEFEFLFSALTARGGIPRISDTIQSFHLRSYAMHG